KGALIIRATSVTMNTAPEIQPLPLPNENQLHETCSKSTARWRGDPPRRSRSHCAPGFQIDRQRALHASYGVYSKADGRRRRPQQADLLLAWCEFGGVIITRHRFKVTGLWIGCSARVRPSRLTRRSFNVGTARLAPATASSAATIGSGATTAAPYPELTEGERRARSARGFPSNLVLLQTTTHHPWTFYLISLSVSFSRSRSISWRSGSPAPSRRSSWQVT
ncbi:MAG: hypothetical protein JWQ44_1001, partial [Chthoniobacter sp.]|nr:hypothetical protein [Chthoniobacter sp.]